MRHYIGRVEVWSPLAVVNVDIGPVCFVHRYQHRLVKISFGEGVAKLHSDAGVKVSYLFDPLCEFLFVRGQMAHQGAANNFAIGFKDV